MSGIKLYPEPKEGEKITIKTFRCRDALRWRTPVDRVLQQAWECVETGEVEWRDIPYGEEAT